MMTYTPLTMAPPPELTEPERAAARMLFGRTISPKDFDHLIAKLRAADGDEIPDNIDIPVWHIYSDLSVAELLDNHATLTKLLAEESK